MVSRWESVRIHISGADGPMFGEPILQASPDRHGVLPIQLLTRASEQRLIVSNVERDIVMRRVLRPEEIHPECEPVRDIDAVACGNAGRELDVGLEVAV